MIYMCVGRDVRPENAPRGKSIKLRNSQLFLNPRCVKASAALRVSALPRNDWRLLKDGA